MGGGETEFRKGRDVTFYQNDYLAPLLPKLAAGRQGGYIFQIGDRKFTVSPSRRRLSLTTIYAFGKRT